MVARERGSVGAIKIQRQEAPPCPRWSDVDSMGEYLGILHAGFEDLAAC